MKLIFATMNPNKVKEIGEMVGPKGIELIGLSELAFEGDIPETSDTLDGNARQKAEYVYKKYGAPCFAEDTGLEVFSLDGEPGVYSARYAGPEKSATANMAKVLSKLDQKKDRSAQFRTVLAFRDHKGMTTFSGRVTGYIGFEEKGNGGFGYDPIFVPDGFDQSFAELPSDIKARISHRAKAWQKFVAYLDKYTG
jgi:XTP/dITP diphosphohydrolase